MLYIPEGDKYSLARSTGWRGNLWRTQDSRCSNWCYTILQAFMKVTHCYIHDHTLRKWYVFGHRSDTAAKTFQQQLKLNQAFTYCMRIVHCKCTYVSMVQEQGSRTAKQLDLIREWGILYSRHGWKHWRVQAFVLSVQTESYTFEHVCACLWLAGEDPPYRGTA